MPGIILGANNAKTEKTSLKAYYGGLCGPDLGAEDKMKEPLAAFCSCVDPAGFPECWSLQPVGTGD